MPPKKQPTTAAETAPDAPDHRAAVALDALYIHPLNSRQTPPDAEIAELADSIRTVGLLQNLSGYIDPELPGRVGIVAGGRRLRALHLIHAGDTPPPMIPVQITHSADRAREWAGAENAARKDPSPADEIVGYRQMRDAGHSPDAIARAFAVTTAHVAKRLALASLPDAAIDALRAGQISYDTAKALTSAADTETAARFLKTIIAKHLTGWQVKELLEANRRSAKNYGLWAFVGADAYHAAGGTSTTDLFADDVWINDTALLESLALDKCKALAAQLQADEGWAWSDGWRDRWQPPYQIQTIPPEGPPVASEAEVARYDVLAEAAEAGDLSDADLDEFDRLEDRLLPTYTDAQRETCGIGVTIDYNGRAQITRGLTRPGIDAATGQDSAGDDSIPVTPQPPEAAMPQNLRDDLLAIRLLALQQALVKAPDQLWRLLAWQMSGGPQPWDQPFNFTSSPTRNTPEKTDGTHVPAHLKQVSNGKPVSLPDFLAANKIPDIHSTHGLARAYCRATGDVADWVAAHTAPDVRALWTPTAKGFLGRCSAGYLDTLWRDLTPDDGSTHAGFLTLKKAEKAQQLERLFADASVREALKLSRDQTAKIDAWLPEDLRFAAPAQPETEAAA